MKTLVSIALSLFFLSLNAQGPNEDFILFYSGQASISSCASADMLDSIRQESYDFTSDEYFPTGVNHYNFTSSGKIETIVQLDPDSRDTLGLTIYEYDNNGNQTVFRFFSLTQGGGLYLASEINDTYDQNNLLIRSTLIGKSFIAPDDTLFYSTNIFQDHDGNGTPLLVETESFDFMTRSWMKESRTINITDGSGNIVTQETEAWDPVLMGYAETIRRVENVFDNGLIFCSSIYTLPIDSPSLTLNSKSTTAYDGNNNRTSVTAERVDDAGNLYLSTKTESTFTSCDLPDVETTSRYDTLTMLWTPVVRNTYYYSPSVAVDEINEIPINTYPNPTTGHVVLSVIDEGPGLLEIYDLSGAKLDVQKIMTNESINLSQYPNGQYLIRLRSGNNNYISKIIKVD